MPVPKVGPGQVLCVEVSVYKGPTELEAKAGDRVAIVGIGGLGHMAMQYANAMGYLNTVDVADDS